MKRKKTGLTMIELLIVLGIIALLVGLLVPALSTVRNIAKETKQKAQFATIEMTLAAFKNDDGDYPPSDPFSWLQDVQEAQNYCGSQKLAEALLGWDLLGFHPDSGWRADGTNRGPHRDPVNPGVIYPPGQYFLYNPNSAVDMDKRKGRYLDLETANAFRLGYSAPNIHDGLFDNTGNLAWNRYVLCDVFGRKTINIRNQVTGETTRYKAGTPILYFKANTSSKYLGDPEVGSIYRIGDNLELIGLGSVEESQQDVRQHPLFLNNPFGNFIQYIMDPKVSTTNRIWPYRPDSYILISAGADGLYGTSDDIKNFGN